LSASPVAVHPPTAGALCPSDSGQNFEAATPRYKILGTATGEGKESVSLQIEFHLSDMFPF